MGIQEFISYYISEVLSFFYLLVLRGTTWYRQFVIYRTSSAFHGTSPQSGAILLVGDGLAEGVGDGLAHGGLAPRLKALLTEHRSHTGLKFNWEVVTVGNLSTSSGDWLPSPERMPQQSLESTRSSELFRNTLVTGPYRNAKIVVIFLGSQKNASEARETVQHITRIADAVARLGKHVLVPSLPLFDNVVAGESAVCHGLNNQLMEELQSIVPATDGGPRGSITFGPDIQRVLVRGGDVIAAENSYFSLNSMGYRAFGRDLHDAVAPLAKRVEWAYWKTQLGGSSTS